MGSVSTLPLFIIGLLLATGIVNAVNNHNNNNNNNNKPTLIKNEVVTLKAGGLAVNVDSSTGEYQIQIDGDTWFNGALIAFHLNNKWYSSIFLIII